MTVNIAAGANGLSLAFAIAACVALASPNADAQSGPIQRGAEAQADPAYEAARRWFESLPAPERRAIQDALVWTGDYNGTNDGNFGKRTRDAIAAFAVRVKKPAYGTLDDAAKTALFAAADKARAAVRFAVLTDPRTGIRIGVPQKLLTKSRASGTGTIWEAADGSASLSMDVAGDTDLPALYARLVAGFPAGRPAYKLLRPDFAVVTGENAGRTVYTRYARAAVDGRAVLRGFSLTYPSAAKATYESLAIAIANSFDPFPSAIAATPMPAPGSADVAPQPQQASAPAGVPTGVVVGSGMVLTSYSVCTNPAVGGRPALTRKRDEASGLTLLEVAGLTARALPVGGESGPEVLVLSFAPSPQSAAPGKVPAPTLQVASGRLQQQAGKTRLAAGLQQPGAGAAIFLRSGSLLGFAMLPMNSAPRLVAGIIPESTYPVAAATEMVSVGSPSPGGDKTAGEVLAPSVPFSYLSPAPRRPRLDGIASYMRRAPQGAPAAASALSNAMTAEPLRKTGREAKVAALAAEPPRAPVLMPSLTAPADAIAKRRRRIARVLGGMASLVIFALSIFVLARTLTNISFADLRGAIAGTTAEQIVGACILTCVSYLALTGYDAVALRQLKARVRYRTTALASFTSYAISFTLGFPLITGGTVRYWLYSRAGLRPTTVASLTIIAGVTFWLGMALIIGTGLLVKADAVSRLDHLTPAINMAFGAGILAALGGYLIWVSVTPRQRKIQGFRLELPGLRLTSRQVALGVTDLCAASGTLFVLLPAHHGLDFLTFVIVYVFASVLGIASHAPGGIGVFEATMLKTVPSPSQEALLASLLLFRVIYYVAPFVLALACLGANESFRRWQSLRDAMLRSREFEPD